MSNIKAASAGKKLKRLHRQANLVGESLKFFAKENYPHLYEAWLLNKIRTPKTVKSATVKGARRIRPHRKTANAYAGEGFRFSTPTPTEDNDGFSMVEA